MCSNQWIEDYPVAMIIDLGTIQVSTELVRKSRVIDYETCEDTNLIYNKIIVKFGNLNATLDYDLNFLRDYRKI